MNYLNAIGSTLNIYKGKELLHSIHNYTTQSDTFRKIMENGNRNEYWNIYQKEVYNFFIRTKINAKIIDCDFLFDIFIGYSKAYGTVQKMRMINNIYPFTDTAFTKSTATFKFIMQLQSFIEKIGFLALHLVSDKRRAYIYLKKYSFKLDKQYIKDMLEVQLKYLSNNTKKETDAEFQKNYTSVRTIVSNLEPLQGKDTYYPTYKYYGSSSSRYYEPVVHSLPNNKLKVTKDFVHGLKKKGVITREEALTISRGIFHNTNKVYSADIRGADFETIKKICNLDSKLDYLDVFDKVHDRKIAKILVISIIYGSGLSALVKKHSEYGEEAIKEMYIQALEKFKPAFQLAQDIENAIHAILMTRGHKSTIQTGDIETQLCAVHGKRSYVNAHLKYKGKYFSSLLYANAYVEGKKVFYTEFNGDEKELQNNKLLSQICQYRTQSKMEVLLIALHLQGNIEDLIFVHDDFRFTADANKIESIKGLLKNKDITFKEAEDILTL